MRTPSVPPRPSESDDGSSRVTRFGTIVGAGLVSAIFSSLPAELRIGDGGSMARAWTTWLVLSSVVLPLGVVVAIIFRRARVGLRLLAGDRVAPLALAVLVWVAGELLLLSTFGALLRSNTHHHGLAGVTFAIFAVASGLGMAVVAARFVRSIGRLGPSWERFGVLSGGLVVFALLVVAGVRGSDAPDLPTSAWLVDGLALSVAAAIASSPTFARVRLFAIVSVPVAAGVLLIGLSLLRMDPIVREALVRHAPLHAHLMDFAAR